MATLRLRKGSNKENAKQKEQETVTRSVSTSAMMSEETVPLVETSRSSNDGSQRPPASQSDGGYMLIPLTQRSTFLRLDVAPFFCLYSALIAADFALRDANDDGGDDDGNQVKQAPSIALPAMVHALFALALMAHLMAFLLQQWSVHARTLVGYRRAHLSALANASRSTRSQWTHCLVEPPHGDRQQGQQQQQRTTSNDAEICAIDVQQLHGNAASNVYVVNFQDILFRCCEADIDLDISVWNHHAATATVQHQHQRSAFRRLFYPISMPLEFFASWKGHQTMDSVIKAQHVYGSNNTPIELPAFVELLQDQLVAPFFLFQVLCVILWSLDEYWYYAIFTFFAILLFECTVAFNRLKGLQRLRSHTSQKALKQPIWVYRPGYPPFSNSWIKVRASEVVPGDVVSLRHHASARPEAAAILNRVPADILLLKGNAVVDESLLTGESVPQLKISLNEVSSDAVSPSTSTSTSTAAGIKSNDDGMDDRCLDLQEHKQSVLFGGTILKVTHGEAENSSDVGKPHPAQQKEQGEDQSKGRAIPPPPDHGIVGFVLRSGFDTAQGSLLRTMAHTQKSVEGIHNNDTYIFILLLVCCALASAMIVWDEGSNDPTRNQFKLLLHVIMIVTIVVPPELPMELSLAVTNSVADLMRRCQVYCTEVFRIPLAGQVDVCCFDKTGTLTSDEMQLKGVRVVQNAQEVTANATFAPTASIDEPLPWEVERIMAGCHSLATNGQDVMFGSGGRQDEDDMVNIIGDPLEKAVLKQSAYRMVQNNILQNVNSNGNGSMNAGADVDVDKNNIAKPQHLLIMKRFAFSSKLKRMSVILRESNSPSSWVITKGAPETLIGFLKPDSIPADYEEVYKSHMSRGERVLAMAYKIIDENSGSSKQTLPNIKEMTRRQAEKDLIFAGFLLMDCPIKTDSKSVISELRSTGHMVVMITGDAVLTAAEVARQVGIVQSHGVGSKQQQQQQQQQQQKQKSQNLSSSAVYNLEDCTDDNPGAINATDPLDRFGFVPLIGKQGDKSAISVRDIIARKPQAPGGSEDIKHKAGTTKDPADDADRMELAITGSVLTKFAHAILSSAATEGSSSPKAECAEKTATAATTALARKVSQGDEKQVLLHPEVQDVLKALVPHVAVFARHAPRQKEAIVAAFNLSGYHTLMCGDGTNDVGALRKAHVGISIISAPEIEAKQRSAVATISSIKRSKKKKEKQKHQDRETQTGRSKSGKGKTKEERAPRSLESSLRQLQEAQEELDQVELGDASIASPFTSRAISIKCCKDVLQQGRCTLVIMLQIYKILGVHCLVNAMVMSKLFLHGVKQGDRQLTVLDIAVASLFFFVTRAKPLGNIATVRPPSSVLCAQVLTSIALQVLVHCGSIWIASEVTLSFVDPYDPSMIPDGPFNPNTLNTCTFLIKALAVINTFAVNYRGRPFMEDLQDNKLMLRTLQVSYAVLLICTLQAFPPLNDLLQLSEFPNTDGGTWRDWETAEADSPSVAIVESIGFPVFMLLLMITDTALVFMAERMTLAAFGG